MGWAGPVTHRQLLVWEEYFRMEMERPSRTDFYLMRVAFEAFFSQRKYPDKIDLEPFRLSFGSKKPGRATKDSGGLDASTATALFKSHFTVSLGLTEFDVEESEPESTGDSGADS